MKACLLKTICLSAIGVILAFSAVTYTSCSTDKCQALVCAYGGICKDGTCICPSGYEGANCQTRTRDRYWGIWQVNEIGTISTQTSFTLAIDTDYSGNAINVRINNFYNRYKLPTTVLAQVKGDTLTIPQQTMPNDDVVQGWGYYQHNGSVYGQNGKLVVYFTVVNAQNVTDDFGVTAGSPSIWNQN